MSLAIQVEDVESVLLPDGWHEVERGTFYLDSYEYLDGNAVLHGGGQSGITAIGFAFLTAAGSVVGPLTAILAVRTAR